MEMGCKKYGNVVQYMCEKIFKGRFTSAMSLFLNSGYIGELVTDKELDYIAPYVKTAHDCLRSKSAQGSDFLGWIDLPECYDKTEFAAIKQSAEKIQNNCDVFIVIGIGGSYLGARAVIEYLKSPLYNNLKKDTPDIYFAGCNISSSYRAPCYLRRKRRKHKRYIQVRNHNRARYRVQNFQRAP